MQTRTTSLVRNTDPLTEGFIPREYPGREDALQQLEESLAAGDDVWVSGPPGTGKTSTVRTVLGRFEDRQVKTAYVNCWSNQTFFSVIEAILQELRALVGDTRDVAFKFERLVRAAKENPLLLVLDEVDQLFLKERNATLYNLCRLATTGLICVGQTRESYLALDPRIQSRFTPAFVTFEPYPADHLLHILEARATQALAEESWCLADLANIAGHAAGDARVAIQTLRTAAYRAERNRVGMIRVADIEEGLRKSSQLRRLYVLKNLTEHHRLLYQIVKAGKEVETRELWKRYVRQARELGIQPMARRTYNQYTAYLIRMRLLTVRQGRGRRNARLFKVIE